MMHRLLGLTLVPVLIVGLATPATALDAPGRKCASAKLKAVAKKTAAKFKCSAKAVAKDVSVDPECLGKAETKYSEAFAKAEAKGGCFNPGDGTTTEAYVDNFVGQRVSEQVGFLPCPTLGLSCSTSCTTTLCLRHVGTGASVCINTGGTSCLAPSCTSDSVCPPGRLCMTTPSGTVTSCCTPCT